MDLHVTLAAGPGATLPSGDATEEIVINTALLTTGGQLRRELAARIGVEQFFVAGRPLQDLVPGVPPLAGGAVIVAGTQDRHTRVRATGNLLLVVRSGPDAGKVVPLTRGAYRIGRSSPDILVRDPELSRSHALLTVTNDAITLTDLRSANGIWVDGSRVEEATVTTDSVIRIGASRYALVLSDTPAPAVDVVDLSEPCDVTAPPPPEPHRLLLVTALLPLVLGVVLAVTTGMWFFLAFSALSAATGLVPLVSGRRKRAAFNSAVATAAVRDEGRRRRAAPDAGDVALAALQPHFHPLGQAAEAQLQRGRYLRLGIADQTAHLLIKSPQPEWKPPIIPAAPLTVPLSSGAGEAREEPVNLTVIGSAETLRNAAHLILLQLSVLDRAGAVVCFGRAPDLPQAARFLPKVSLVTDRAHLDQLLAADACSTLLLFGSCAGAMASPPGVRVYRFCPPAILPEGNHWTADYSQMEPVLVSPQSRIPFQPDFVQAETFDHLARALGTHTAAPQGSDTAALPDHVTVSELVSWDNGEVVRRWRGAHSGARVPAVIGSSRRGPLVLDLVADGPHLLVAGTTGSGKSEFLRSMVLSLCLNHSPADLNFLFIDFKGGSGLGLLTGLPHVTSMLTDLSPASVSRALVSLRAEVKRRETLFATYGATDYHEYRAGTDRAALPRLALVIDEFRMLSEEVPGSVQELMRIATLGRSLGLHLVLATQRPQGAVTSDIRANVTASVALRMQSPMESQDVLESPIASTIPVHRRGRAFLRVGGGQPVEFQTATTAAGGTERPPAIASLESYLGVDDGPDVVPTGALPAADIDALIAAVRTAAEVVPSPPPHKPILPDLPDLLLRDTANLLDSPDLGLLDVPEAQEQYRLAWHPLHDSHLAFVGQPAGGLASALPFAVGEMMQHFPDTHTYILDGDGSLRCFAEAPQTGAYVGAAEIRRAARVLQRVAEEVTVRLGTAHPPSRTAAPSLAVVISGWGRWAGSFRAGRYGWAEESLQDIARDGEAAGITLLIGGDRELISSRFYSLLPNRLYFPAGMSPEALLSWPRLPVLDPIPGRVFVQGRISTPNGSAAQLILQAPRMPTLQPAVAPFAVAALPPRVGASELESRKSNSRCAVIPVGLGGDDLSTQYLAMPERAVALIIGPPRSGRSHALELIARQAPSALRCVRPGRGQEPAAFWREAAANGVTSQDLLLIDDADQLPRETHQYLAQLAAAGARVILALSPSLALIPSIPLAASVRTQPLGLVLGARSPSDGDIFGLRLDVDGAGPVGRGFLVDSRGALEVQIADLDRRETLRRTAA